MKTKRNILNKLFPVICFLILAAPVASARAAEQSVNSIPVFVTGTTDYSKDFEVLALTNKLRADGGLAPLAMDRELMEAATQRAAECAFVFAHLRPDRSNISTASSKLHGENIAAGYNYLTTAKEAVTGWKNSPGHYANIMTSDYQSIGVGHFTKDGCTYWVQCFSWDEAESVSLSGTRSTKYTVNVSADAARSGLQLQLSKDTLQKGASEKLSLKYMDPEPNYAFMAVSLDPDGFRFTSSAPNVASVNSAGKVSALSAGTATITATSLADPSVSVSVKCTVNSQLSRKVKLNGKGGKFTKGKATKTIYVVNGAKYGSLPSPSRKGYTFAGWFDSNGKRIRAATKVSIKKGSTKNLYAKWKKVTVGQTSVSQAKSKKGGILNIRLRKVSGAKRYQIYICADKKFKKKNRITVSAAAKKRAATVTCPLTGKYVYVKARACKYDSAGKTVYGKFSAVKKVRLR